MLGTERTFSQGEEEIIFIEFVIFIHSIFVELMWQERVQHMRHKDVFNFDI